MLAGPTGVGKTALSLDLAERMDAEIISADSRQVFRGLDIGTAPPSMQDRSRVPHHFIQERKIGEPWTAGQFAAEANVRIQEILNRNRLPLIVGGSTLYLEALLFGLADVPRGNPHVRAALTQQASTPAGAAALFAELQRVDPEAARTVDPSKTQRIVRGLEVYHSAGRPWSSFWSDREAPPFRYAIHVLTRPRAELYERIDRRVDGMLEAGLVAENERLMAEGYSLDTNPLRTIGYQEPIAYLRGELTYTAMVERLKRNSRRYAKRQLTWFRRWESASWVDLQREPPDAVLEQLSAAAVPETDSSTKSA